MRLWSTWPSAGRRCRCFAFYHLMRLSPALTSCAEQAHPVVSAGGRHEGKRGLPGAWRTSTGVRLPAGPAPDDAARLFYTRDLRSVRELVAEHAAAAGLSRGRTADLIIAASEVAANTLKHTPNGGQLLIWHTCDEVICQLADRGTISDPLAGRRRPDRASSGYGLWVVNQICDLVELRSAPGRTVARLHMRL